MDTKQRFLAGIVAVMLLTTIVGALAVQPPAVITQVATMTPDGTYGPGAAINFTVAFDKEVTVNHGTPTLDLNSGGTATYLPGTNSSNRYNLTFQYIVAAGESSADLGYNTTGSLRLNGATIKAGPDADITLPSPSVFTAAHAIVIGVTDGTGNATNATDNSTNTTDTTPPVITILGDNPASVNLSATYTDAGATATDDTDGSIVPTVTSDVDTGVAGTYHVLYQACDAAMNCANATRTVHVLAITADPTISAAASDITTSSARITAIGSESMTFTVYYGIGNMTETYAGGTGTSMNIVIGGLLPNTAYDYLVKGCTESVCVETAVQGFTTLEEGVADTTPPVTGADAGSYAFGTWTGGPVTVALSCVDNTACATTYVCVDQEDACDPAEAGTGAMISADGRWYVRYKSVDTFGNWETPAKSSVVLIDSVLPTVAANVIATTGTSADVSATSNKVVDFTIFFGPSSDVGTMGGSILAFDTTNTITTISGLAPVTRYYYYVSACDEAGWCAYTDVASFTSGVPSVVAETYGETGSSVLFNLTSDVPVNFTIYFGPGDMTSTAMAGNMDTTVNGYMLDELQENTLYNYKVIGCTADNICGPTDPVVKQFTTLGIAPTLEVSVYRVTPTSASLFATSSETAHFTLTWGIGDSFSSGNIDAGTSVATDVTMGELIPGTTYTYNLMACDAAGICANSGGEFTTPLQFPIILDGTNTTDNSTEQETGIFQSLYSGHSGGDCSWGYERDGDACVKIASERVLVNDDSTSSSENAPDDLPAEEGDVPDAAVGGSSGNLLTGNVIGEGGEASWVWLAILVGLVLLGTGAYVTTR